MFFLHIFPETNSGVLFRGQIDTTEPWWPLGFPAFGTRNSIQNQFHFDAVVGPGVIPRGFVYGSKVGIHTLDKSMESI
jgi:hypothetical protein